MEPDRWERLAESLWSEADEGVDDELVRAVAEAETAQVTLVHRLRVSHELVVHAGDLSMVGTVEQVGPEAVVLGTNEWTWLVPLSSVTAIEGLALALAWDGSGVAERLGLTSMLRSLVGQRVQVHLAGGRSVFGTMRSVGADHIDIAVDAPGSSISVTTNAITAIQVAR
ncbi:MAG: hypothetical protein NT180_09420 [Actinobacteria bacterium]|nr:hypothetical protein [Actinomycetota bacterium]